MGTYLNPGNQNFLSQIKTGRYVDKTMLLHLLNGMIDDSSYKYVCVSRPRRFGKSIAGNMVAAYYSKGAESRELFSPYKIADTESFGDHLNKYNVIKIDFRNYNR